MQYRKLGKTGLDVSIIGLGGIYLIGLSNLDAVRLILKADEAGINLVETGRTYQDSEQKIGLVMMKKRHEFNLASKTPVRTENEAQNHIDESLAALRTDYIDIYQLHEVDSEEQLNKAMGPGGALEALKRAQKQGKVGFIGITGHSPAILVKAIHTGEFDTVQVLFNLVEREALNELIPLANRMNIGVMGMKPFGGGAFLEPNSRIAQILNPDTVILPEILLRYALSSNVATVLTGMKTIDELNRNVAAGAGFTPMPAGEIEKLVESVQTTGKDEPFCHRCGYCLPCPQGINIPLVIRLNEYYGIFGSREWPVRLYGHMDGKADKCVGCGICESKCPFGIRIREQLQDAHRILQAVRGEGS